MGERAYTRGVSVPISSPLPAGPDGVMFYASGPVTYAQFQRFGQPWLAVYRAKHDEVGWLVHETICRPLVLMPGDHLHIRVRLIEDRGDEVQCAVVGKRGTFERTFPRETIVFLEEAAQRADS